MTTFFLFSNLLLWVVVLFQIVMFFTISRSVGQFLKRFQLPLAQDGQSSRLLLGSKAPLFSELDHRGEVVTLNKHNGNRTLLFFTHETCKTSQAIIGQLTELHWKEPDMRVIVVAPDDTGAIDLPVPFQISVIRSNSMLENYRIRKIPYFVIINADGYVVDLNDQLELKRVAG